MTELQQRRLRLAGRWLLTGLVFALVVQFIDAGILWQELARLSPMVLVPALVLSLLQVAVSAWRWRFTAGCLGLPLRFGQAVQEYYLATFLNQVLPGGVLGDVNRAWRHGIGAGERLAAMHAVVIERLSGQLALLLVVSASVGGLMASGQLATEVSTGSLLLWLAGLLGVALLAWLALGSGLGAYLRRLRRDLYHSLLRGFALPVQLASSLLVVASYLGVFLVLAEGAGYTPGPGSTLVVGALASVLLLSMVIPFTVAGWGVREGAAAVIWPLAGLPAEQGVALSVAYGVIGLVSSLPGAAMLFVTRGSAAAAERSGA